MLTGVVKWFNDAKGFGFIEHTSGKDVFVHYSVIEWDGFKTLKDGEKVLYELKEGEKGLHAARVTRPNTELTAEEIAANSAEQAVNEPNQDSEATQPLSAQIEVISENTPPNEKADDPFSKTEENTEENREDSDFPEQ